MIKKVYEVLYQMENDDYQMCYGYFTSRKKAEDLRNKFVKYDVSPHGEYVIIEHELDIIEPWVEDAIELLKKIYIVNSIKRMLKKLEERV